MSRFFAVRSLSRVFLAALVVLACVARAAAADWARTEWRGEKAWVSVSAGGWTAVVSADRARLIALTPPGGGANLLFAEQKDEFTWGGHRFWLGPQTAWVAMWPPPADWERSAAERIDAEGGTLRVTQPRTNENYPRITRTYAWRRDTLHCTAAWSDARFQGIHILQLPPEAVVRVKRKAAVGLPLGYALLPVYKRDGILTDREAAREVARVEGDTITLRNAKVTEKIGVAPQAIVAELGGSRLVLRRGAMTGMSDTRPDLGLLTQVFLGSDRSIFTEIEQLTPLGGEGEAVSEILIDLSKIGVSAGPVLRNPVRR